MRRSVRSESVKVKARTKGYFANTAADWDKMREDFFDQIVAESMVKTSGVEPGSVIVDVGCGTGFLTQQVALETQGNAKIVGVDLSASMLEKAKENLMKLATSETVELRVSDAEDLPVEDEFADVVVGNMVLHHCPRPRRAIAEMNRILKKGGRVVVADLEKHDQEWLREEMAARWLGFELGEVGKWFEAAGLVDVKVELARTKCRGVALSGRKAEIGIFIVSGSKPKQ